MVCLGCYRLLNGFRFRHDGALLLLQTVHGKLGGRAFQAALAPVGSIDGEGQVCWFDEGTVIMLRVKLLHGKFGIDSHPGRNLQFPFKAESTAFDQRTVRHRNGVVHIRQENILSVEPFGTAGECKPILGLLCTSGTECSHKDCRE